MLATHTKTFHQLSELLIQRDLAISQLEDLKFSDFDIWTHKTFFLYRGGQ